MVQPSIAAPGAEPPRACPSCGQPFLAPVPRCPRCGGLVGQKGRSNRAAIAIVVVVLGVFGALPCVGSLAAIAIPNFIRYQLRSKQSELRAELSALVKAEQEAFRRDGHYVALGPVPAGGPGPQKTALSTEELEAAGRLDWMVGPSLYGQYRVEVGHDEAGGEAASFCAEADLDGDGRRSVFVAFLPLVRGGEVVGALPAPCTEPVSFGTEHGGGEVVGVSADGIF